MKNLLITCICAMVFLLLFATNLQAKQEQRLALLIGNSHYTHGGSLDNPVNDVRAIKKALEGLGLQVSHCGAGGPDGSGGCGEERK
jgi:hypothetical protein